jgi:hypothetical protein
MELINKQIEKENLIDNKSRFISKWIFIIPSTIKNTNQILSCGLSSNIIGFKLSIWKST